MNEFLKIIIAMACGAVLMLGVLHSSAYDKIQENPNVTLKQYWGIK